jgi:hypothetical protein
MDIYETDGVSAEAEGTTYQSCSRVLVSPHLG